MTRQEILNEIDRARLPESWSVGEGGGVAPSTWSPADYVKLLNVNTAKVLALCLVGGFAIYHSVLHATYDVTPCKGLLKDGMYKGSMWQPWGCMMHIYTKIDSERCFRYSNFWGKNSHIVFVGDSKVYQIYSATRKWLESGHQPVKMDPEFIYSNSVWENPGENLKLEYLSAPEVNGSMIKSLEKWSKGAGPTVLVIGAGTESIRRLNGSIESLDEFRRNLTRLKPELENLVEFGGTKVLWAVQTPVNVDNMNGSNKAISNDMIWQFNMETTRVLGKSSVLIWYSLYRLAEGSLDGMEDGYHLSKLALTKSTQMILNLVCNDNMNFNDGSCCKSSDHRTTLQTVSFSILGITVIVSIMIILYELFCRRRSDRYRNYRYERPPGTLAPFELPSNSFTGFIFPLARLAVIMAYFYICDRTNFFMKENKYFTPINFWLPVLYLTVLGLFFNDESSNTNILHRDQMDEWKGWMQMVILVYHMTGANISIPIYLHVRVLITAFLFLLGYTHFLHFWTKSSGGTVTRFLQVLFKMNFLTFTLCLCMNRPYQFYYFSPLLSFWYLVLFCVLKLPPVVTQHTIDGSNNPVTQYLYVILKFAGVVAVISTLYMSEVFFEKVFVTRPWKALFVTTDDDIHEWWFRWKLDRYTIIYGCMFSLAIIIGSKLKVFDDSSLSSLWPRTIAVPASGAAIIGLCSYTVFACLCKYKTEGNEIHPYVAFVPIISWIVLRNMAGLWRSRYSSFFAWFGRISLELLISQYHIWLSADSHGVLVLIPNYPVMNLLFTSFIFVCACHEIHCIVSQLLPYFVPPEPIAAARNVVVFILILVPIGIHDGMF